MFWRKKFNVNFIIRFELLYNKGCVRDNIDFFVKYNFIVDKNRMIIFVENIWVIDIRDWDMNDIIKEF